MVPLPFNILWSVGQLARNTPTDVAATQVLLNLAAKPGVPVLRVDGKFSPAMLEALRIFQAKCMGVSRVELSVQPGSPVARALIIAAIPAARRVLQFPPGSATEIVESDYQNAAEALGCEVAAVKAVAAVESAGRGFFPSKRPKILFEALQFGDATGHNYDRLFPDISSPTWNRSLYTGGEREYHRLEKAMLLDRAGALGCASWGKFQILGMNYAISGHKTLDSFIGAMFKSEGAHLDAFCAYVKSRNLASSLKTHDWKTFARAYNGRKFYLKHYDRRIEEEYNKASVSPTPKARAHVARH